MVFSQLFLTAVVWRLGRPLKPFQSLLLLLGEGIMRSRHQSIDWGQFFYFFYFFTFCDVEILANFVTKITKLVKFTLEKQHFSKISRTFLWQKKAKICFTKNTNWGGVNLRLSHLFACVFLRPPPPKKTSIYFTCNFQNPQKST